jgi:hypothetical protein
MGLMRRKTASDELRRAALTALASALEQQAKQRGKSRKPKLTGVRALATGAVIYTAGRAAFANRELLRDQLSGDGRVRDEEDEQDEPVEEDEPRAEEQDQPEDEEYEEPSAEEDEDYEEPSAEEDEEPEDEQDEEPSAEEEEEPSAEEDEDYDEPSAEEEDDYEEEEEEPQPPPRRKPTRSKRDSAPSLELPSRPSRPRAPVKT